MRRDERMNTDGKCSPRTTRTTRKRGKTPVARISTKLRSSSPRKGGRADYRRTRVTIRIFDFPSPTLQVPSKKRSLARNVVRGFCIFQAYQERESVRLEMWVRLVYPGKPVFGLP